MKIYLYAFIIYYLNKSEDTAYSYKASSRPRSTSRRLLLPKIIQVGGSSRLPIRGQDVWFPPRHPLRGPLFTGFSPIRLPSSGCLAYLLLRPRSHPPVGSSRVSVVQQPRSAARALLAKQSPSDLLMLHLVGNIIPSFLPPLLMGYLLWDLSPVSDIYRGLAELTEASSSLTSLAGPVNVNSTSLGQHMVEASCSLEGNRAALVLLEAAKRPGEENQAVASVPDDKTPAKIAIWVAGILLSISITTLRLVARRCQET